MDEGIGCRIYSYGQEKDGRHWRYWSITDDETALLVSYTCSAGDKDREAEDVDAVVGSIRLFRSASVH